MDTFIKFILYGVILAIVSLLLYFIIKKAVKDAIRESQDRRLQ